MNDQEPENNSLAIVIIAGIIGTVSLMIPVISVIFEIRW